MVHNGLKGVHIDAIAGVVFKGYHCIIDGGHGALLYDGGGALLYIMVVTEYSVKKL